jgi:AAA15 family ATPase/GTPase
MLVQFSVRNYLSFKDKVTLSMVANDDLEHHREDYIAEKGGLHLLKAAAIYGANASGKSNLLKAMEFMKNFVIKSLYFEAIDEFPEIESFALSTETDQQPSEFEIAFIIDKTIYRYGFSMDQTKIHSEWLYHLPDSDEEETPLFERNGDKFSLHEKFSEGKDLIQKTKKNVLFLTVIAHFNGHISQRLVSWFTHSLQIILPQRPLFLLRMRPIRLIQKQSELKKEVVHFLQCADVGIEDIELVDPEEMNNIVPNKKTRSSRHPRIMTKRSKFDQNGEVTSSVFLDLDSESEGTKKLFNLSPFFIQVLKRGGTLIVDELDAKLHSLITWFILTQFRSAESNPHHAQLIFTTHDTSILSSRFFRQDQIWFTEKTPEQATDLYSLVDYKIEEPDSTDDDNYRQDYIRGKYGAIPFIGYFDLHKYGGKK